MPKYMDKYLGKEIEYGEGFISKEQLKEAESSFRLQGGLGIQKDSEFKLPQEPRLSFQDNFDVGWTIFIIGIIILLLIILGFMVF